MGSLVARETALKGETDPICEFITERKQMLSFGVSLVDFGTYLRSMYDKNRLHFLDIDTARRTILFVGNFYTTAEKL